MSKTTLQGVITILAGVCTFVLSGLKTGNFADTIAITVLLTAVTSGLGLIHAADAPKL